MEENFKYEMRYIAIYITLLILQIDLIKCIKEYLLRIKFICIT